MAITPIEKRSRISAKKTEIEQLKYDRDLLISQKQSLKDIKALESRIATAKQELELIDALTEKEQGQPVTIEMSGGFVNQINTGTNIGNVIQNNISENQIDLVHLEKELLFLLKEMKKRAKTIEHDIAVGAVAQASVAAKSNERSKVFEHLQSAGKWAWEVATKIGTNLATEALKLALGL